MGALRTAGIGIVDEHINSLVLQTLDKAVHTVLVAEVHLYGLYVLEPADECLCLVLMSAIGKEYLIIRVGGTGLYQRLP